MVKVKKDLTGRQFGRLIVIQQVDDYIKPNGQHVAMWKCQCCCENKTIKIISGTHLKQGETLSCGCLQKENTAAAIKKYNEFSDIMQDEYGEYMLCYSNPDKKFISKIDAVNYDLIKQYSWCVNNGYFVSRINNKLIGMHQLLFGSYCDHIDGDRSNNRAYNIRHATIEQNNMNVRNRRVGKSGYRGVIIKNGKYQAKLTKNIGNKRIGFFGKMRNSPEEAYIDYLNLAAKYQGEWASVASDFIKYGIEIPQEAQDGEA